MNRPQSKMVAVGKVDTDKSVDNEKAMNYHLTIEIVAIGRKIGCVEVEVEFAVADVVVDHHIAAVAVVVAAVASSIAAELHIVVACIAAVVVAYLGQAIVIATEAVEVEIVELDSYQTHMALVVVVGWRSYRSVG